MLNEERENYFCDGSDSADVCGSLFDNYFICTATGSGTDGAGDGKG